MSLVILPDVEAELSRWLRIQPELQTLVDTRVYTVIPGNAEFPLVTLRRITGSPPLAHVNWFDQPVIQVEAYGGTKAQARTVAATVMALLQERLVGAILNGAMVTVGLDLVGYLYLPDSSWEPAKPRYLFSANLMVRPTSQTETP